LGSSATAGSPFQKETTRPTTAALLLLLLQGRQQQQLQVLLQRLLHACIVQHADCLAMAETADKGCCRTAGTGAKFE
jgi:hypothetical protein